MIKRWQQVNIDSIKVEQLSAALKVRPLIAELLVSREVETFEQAHHFFRPSLDHLHDPFLMKDMDKAIERIVAALNCGEKILVYGDYDVDGTTAVSLVYSFFHSIGAIVDYYIPDRYKEGYGISFAGIDFAKENNFSLIIALDCGIKSIDKVSYAKEKGVDFIICDHHRPGDSLPDAVAVLDPKRVDCTYPYNELSGCGVGFKLVQAYAQKVNLPKETVYSYLDLVAVSIAADIVPITGENRVLTYFGLEKLNSQPRQGIKTILELNDVKKKLTITDVVFIIAPRINAAGRIDSGNKAVELLISSDPGLAKISGEDINRNNTDRKGLDTEITRQALEMIAASHEMVSRKSTVIYHTDWHKGVVGIVASRLTEKFYRPTIVLTENDGKYTGSARSVKDFDIYEAIDKCSELLEQFGGHKYAAGLTLRKENIEAFVSRFEEVVCASITEELLIPEITIDGEMDISQITPKFYNLLKQFAPFGPGNMCPVFISKGVMDRGYARIVGNQDKHLRMDLYNPLFPNISFPSIGFGLGEKLSIVNSGKPFEVAYSIEENEWNNTMTLQLNIKDIRPAT